jgi:hypothetical protein
VSVLMMLRLPVDAAGLERAAHDNGDLIKGISKRAHDRGAIHHDFYERDGEVIVVDEWESPEAFEAFFEAEGGNIGQLMQAAGATGAPGTPSFHRKMSVGDEF